LRYSYLVKIILAAPLYPPEIGGPSQYALKLSEVFRAQGHEVRVARYGALKYFPSGIRHVLYACKLFTRALGADVILGFDTYSVGLPAALVSSLTRTPLILRVGGDFLWETYINRTGKPIPLTQFYSHARAWGTKERTIFRLTCFTLARATLVFNSRWLSDIWSVPYALDPARVHIVENEYVPCEGGTPSARKNFLFFSRDIPLKNRDAFRRAFKEAKKTRPDIVLEEGLVPHEEFMQMVRGCYAVVVPSISEVAPNYVLDALRFGKPFLLTKYSGYAERFKEYGVIVDPLDESDMARGIEELCKPEVYARLTGNIRAFRERHTYDDIAKEFLALVTR
jgi:glycosyltransferase involved in cell wall biosynthesis